jgi:hypothetical protein
MNNGFGTAWKEMIMAVFWVLFHNSPRKTEEYRIIHCKNNRYPGQGSNPKSSGFKTASLYITLRLSIK